MSDIDYLFIGLAVMVFVILANLLFFIAMPMMPLFVKKLKSKFLTNKIETSKNAK